MVERIKKSCAKAGLSLAELERDAALGENTIYRWDTNLPRIDRVVRVASRLDVSVDYLLELTDEEKPAAYSDGLDDKHKLLIHLFDYLTEPQQEVVIAQLQGLALLPQDQAAPQGSE